MKKIIILLILICACAVSAHARALTGNDLVEDAQFYDGARIEFLGEVIGDIMARGDHVWININDGTRAIGVWAKRSTAKHITTAGDYGHIGDKVMVYGTFNRSCPQHGGDLDIHASRIVLIEKGKEVQHPVDIKRALVCVVLLLMVLAVIFLPRALKVSS